MRKTTFIILGLLTPKVSIFIVTEGNGKNYSTFLITCDSRPTSEHHKLITIC